MIPRSALRSLAILALALAACGATRKRGQYGTPISMSSEEGERVDRLEAGAKALGNDYHRQCGYWEQAEKRMGRDAPGLASYVRESRQNACDQDPAYEYERPVAVREAFFAGETAGYQPDGPVRDLQLGGGLTVPLERGRCYYVLYRFAEGYAPKHRLQFEYKRPGESSHSSTVRGPGALVDMGCVFRSAPGVVRFIGDDSEPPVSAQVQLVAKTLSPAETAREEAAYRARRAQAERDARAWAPDKRSHCQRCRDAYGRCIDDRVAGERAPWGTCIEGYVQCLDEDRGDGRMTASECVMLE